MWKQKDALGFLRFLETALRGTAHVALAGSVLYRGNSSKDLDVIVYPHTKKGVEWDPTETQRRIERALNAKLVKCESLSGHYRDDKQVAWLILPSTGQRIDFFFLS